MTGQQLATVVADLTRLARALARHDDTGTLADLAARGAEAAEQLREAQDDDGDGEKDSSAQDR